MYRFNRDYFKEFQSFASKNLGGSLPVPDRKRYFDKWITKFNQKTKFSDSENLRKEHNAVYNDIVKSIQINLEKKDLKYTKDVFSFVSQV